MSSKSASGPAKRPNQRSEFRLINKKTALGRTYEGPLKFTGVCKHCGEPRKRHCGRCRACPGHHWVDCMVSHATGAWH